MPRYFKIIEIDSDTFTNVTDIELDCCQVAVPEDDGVYVAVDDDEYKMQISMWIFDYGRDSE